MNRNKVLAFTVSQVASQVDVTTVGMNESALGAIRAPDRSIPRLFVGGLSSGVTDSALTRLLGKFGNVGPIERHSTRNFAHVSMNPRDETSLERCIAALNNTTWCGASLRVQKAREHFWHRLEREWQEPENSEEKGEPNGEEEEDGPTVIHFKGAGIGKHAVFSFPDLAEDVVTDLVGFDEDMDKNNGNDDEEGEENALTIIQDDLRQPSKAHVPKSATLSSTMQLFGLSDASSVVHKRNASSGISNEEKPMRSEERPAKRPRKKSSAIDIEKAEAAAHEPGLINLESEKETALSVLRDIFPTTSGAGRTRDELIAANRRLGLFRKLKIKQSSEQSGKQQRNRVRNGRGSSKTRGPVGPSLLSTPQDLRKMQTDADVPPQNFQRAGLYTELMLSTASKTPSDDGQREEDSNGVSGFMVIDAP